MCLFVVKPFYVSEAAKIFTTVFFFLNYFIGKDTEAQRGLSDILTYIFQSRPEPEFKPVSHDSLCISLPTISCLVFMKFIIFIVMDFSF